MDSIDRAVICPKIEVAINRAFGGKIFGYCPPLAAGRQNIHQTVDNFPHVDHPFSAATFCGRDQRLDQRPLGIGQITGITQTATIIPLTVFCRPHWRSSGRITNPPIESQMTHPIQIFFGQTLSPPAIGNSTYRGSRHRRRGRPFRRRAALA